MENGHVFHRRLVDSTPGRPLATLHRVTEPATGVRGSVEDDVQGEESKPACADDKVWQVEILQHGRQSNMEGPKH